MARIVLLAFLTQVLLRPSRIGTLAALGGMIGIVVVGAEGWWLVLGIVLFQAAACALLGMWLDIAEIVQAWPQHPPGHAEQTPAQSQVGRPGRAPVIPRPRQATPEE